MRNASRFLHVLAAASLMGGALGCAETVGDIDRTQPGKLHKSLFRADKTWYYKQTIVDVSPTASMTFVGVGSDVFKIRFEITEARLNAYRVHEFQPGLDPDVDPAHKDVGDSRPLPGRGFGVDPGLYKESLIAAWPILGHFDVIRQYNSTTGEQQNVITENTTDRPWYEREYLRVNWQNNMAPNFNLLDAGLTGLSSVVTEGEADADPRNALHFEDAAGNVFDSRDRRVDDQVVYFDTSTKWNLAPGFCLAGDPQNCVPEDAWVRHSFARIDDRRDQDYEVATHDDLDQSKFGFFRTERFTRDRRRGSSDSGRLYMANRHRLWEASYERASCEGVDQRIAENRQARETFAATGDSADRNELARMDKEFVILAGYQADCAAGQRPFQRTLDGNRIPIPYEDRVPRPITYYANDEHPEQLMATVRDIADEWNRAFRRVTAYQCGVEVPNGTEIEGLPNTLAGGEDPAGRTCKQLAEAGVVPDMFRLVENRDGAVRNGDVRRNFIYWVDQHQAAGPLGFGPSYADHETGELISGTAYVYGAAVDAYAAEAMDIIDVLDGYLTLENLKNGQHVKEWIERNRDRVDPRRIAAAQAKALGVTAEEFLALDVRDQAALSLTPQQMNVAEAIQQNGVPEGSSQFEKFQMDKIKGTDLERLLLHGAAGDEILSALSKLPEFQRAAPNWRPGDTLPDDVFEKFSPAQWLFGSALRQMSEEEIQFFATRNVLKAEFVDDSIIGLALEYKGESDPERVYQDLRARIYKGVMLHEIGHTVGLRHNFEGSFDAFNFHDEYWDMRKENLGDGRGKPLAMTENLTGELVRNEAAFTESQKQGRMTEYSYSSIMDYSMKFNGDLQGLGKYDHAAVLFGYANAVEVFDETSRQDVIDNLDRFMTKFAGATELDVEKFLEDLWENRTHPRDDHPLKIANYTHVPYWLGGADLNAGIQSLRTRHVVDYGTLKAQRDEGNAETPLEVPYMFCGDEWVGSILSCNRWDQGANFFEINSNAISAYFNYYFFDHFRRDRAGFNPYGVATRIYERYFSLMTDTYRFGLWSGALWGAGLDPVLTDIWRAAIETGFQTLLSVISTPSYGSYVLQDDGRYHQWSWETENPAPGTFVVNQGIGRRWSTRYLWDAGYNYYDYPLEAGHFWDWVMALTSLTESTFTLLGNETASDFRTYSIPYYLWYTQPLTRWFNSLVMEDSDAIAPRVLDGGLQFLSIYDEGDKGDPIDLDLNFQQQYYGMLYGMAGFRSSYSLTFADQMKVYRVGSGESIVPGGGYEAYEASDPITGVTYATLTKLRWDPEACFVEGRGPVGDWVPDYPDFPSNIAALQDVTEVAPPPARIIRDTRCMQIRKDAFPKEDRRRQQIERRVENNIDTLNLLRRVYEVFGFIDR